MESESPSTEFHTSISMVHHPYAVLVLVDGERMSSPQICGKPPNPNPNNHLQPTKNLPISFMPLGKIEPEAKKAPEIRGLAL
jgi:hypothetical protein